MTGLAEILTGGIATGSSIAGLFFLRFWHRTRDLFFLCFALSFWLELVSYGLIPFAIWHKNRPRR